MEEFEGMLARLGLSKAGFARWVGLSERTVYRWESVPTWAEQLLACELRRRDLQERLSRVEEAMG